MKRHYRRRRNYKRRRSLSASNWGPILALTGTVLGVLATLALLIFFAIPKLLELVGLEHLNPFAPAPTPTPAPAPTPTPHPMEIFDASTETVEVVFDTSLGYRWFADPYIFDGRMIVSAGLIEDGNAVFHDLYFYEPQTRSAKKLDIEINFDYLFFPKFNKNWLVYFDGKAEGGGYLMGMNLTEPDSKPFIIKEIFTGQPEPMLDGSYVAWNDRTGTKMSKLFVCDLNTLESTVIHMFSGTVYGQSLPSIRGGRLIWADADTTGERDSDDTSVIYSMTMYNSSIGTYSPEMYVHDPEVYGEYYAWLDAHHAPYSSLYYCESGSDPIKIADGVAEFGLSENFIAYSKNEAIYVYYLNNGKTYRINAEYEAGQFLGVSDGCVIWLDVTSRERDIVKFVRIP